MCNWQLNTSRTLGKDLVVYSIALQFSNNFVNMADKNMLAAGLPSLALQVGIVFVRSHGMDLELCFEGAIFLGENPLGGSMLRYRRTDRGMC